MFLLAQLQHSLDYLTLPAALIMGVAGLVILIRGRKSLKGTSLLGPWGWCLFAWVAVCGAEVLIAVLNMLQVSIPEVQIRYVAAMTLFCPQMSQIGAKRSQTVVWQLVVGVFWLVLCSPLLMQWLGTLNGNRDPGWPWDIFLSVLILAGFLNNGLTRYGITAVCLTIAQILLTYPTSHGTSLEFMSTRAIVSIGFLLLGMALVALDWPSRPQLFHREDRAWLDFRDCYGSFWALRVMQRVNEAAVRFDWGLWLGWNGFSQVEIVGSHPEFREEVSQALVSCLRKLLGDFVDDDWLDARLPRPTQKKRGLEEMEA
ncbi:hypothetical protein GC197_07475 [bacterium]|nr:hypothetical protein [bacterium]